LIEKNHFVIFFYKVAVKIKMLIGNIDLFTSWVQKTIAPM